MPAERCEAMAVLPCHFVGAGIWWRTRFANEGMQQQTMPMFISTTLHTQAVSAMLSSCGGSWLPARCLQRGQDLNQFPGDVAILVQARTESETQSAGDDGTRLC
jgi:hypothetical protein